MPDPTTEKQKVTRPPSGPIQAGTIYHIEDFKRRMGWARHAMRTAERNGLKIIRTAGRAYVMGDHALEYFDQI